MLFKVQILKNKIFGYFFFLMFVNGSIFIDWNISMIKKFRQNFIYLFVNVNYYL